MSRLTIGIIMNGVTGRPESPMSGNSAAAAGRAVAQTSRTVEHFAELFRLACEAGAFPRP
jgi:hypothetical protein